MLIFWYRRDIPTAACADLDALAFGGTPPYPTPWFGRDKLEKPLKCVPQRAHNICDDYGCQWITKNRFPDHLCHYRRMYEWQ